MNRSPRALVTGGCGFIGTNLGRALAERAWDLVAFDDLSAGDEGAALRAGYREVIRGDVRDEAALRAAAAGADYVVHLAAHTSVIESIDDPRNDIEINVLGTLNALLAARDCGARSFVFASSNAPLGEAEAPSHEGRVPRPISPYGASKLAGEALCSAFSGAYGLPTTALRFSNAYGPHSAHKGSVVAKFLKSALAGGRLVIYGDGAQTRDFVFVDDLSAGIVLALEARLNGELFHLGSGVETTIEQLARQIGALFPDRSIEIRYEPARAGEIRRNYSDVGKARRMLGFEPRTSLADGLRATSDWFAAESSE